MLISVRVISFLGSLGPQQTFVECQIQGSFFLEDYHGPIQPERPKFSQRIVLISKSYV